MQMFQDWKQEYGMSFDSQQEVSPFRSRTRAVPLEELKQPMC
jgi:hypothetical protein